MLKKLIFVLSMKVDHGPKCFLLHTDTKFAIYCV